MQSEETYLNSPSVILDPGSKYAADTRTFQGISSLACGRNGRVWAVWYGGPTPAEDENNYVILAVSSDFGRTWSKEKLVIEHPDPMVRDFDPEIWLDPNGKIWLFWAQHSADNRYENSRSGVWAITATEADGADAAWSEPRRLADGVMMCKPLVLSNGEWALPVSFWHRREADSPGIVVSTDQGATWIERGAASVAPEHRTFDEHMIVERRDGSLWMLVRTNYGIGESVSKDGGRSWSPLAASSIPHVNSRFFIRRLRSGKLLLVRNNPGEGNLAQGKKWGVRSHMTAYLSDDDGASWQGGLLLDERPQVSYPDGDQAEDGTIHITYDYDRYNAREIYMASFREEDVASGKPVSDAVRLRVLINKATAPIPEKKPKS
jgi:predicted neuraminidase